ncbi:hypothetical protein H310_06868 [Aphanomyces invadans]|uniref:Uncharacterized protein n=1 Tax=Aphanomyces invadans TaxID=157072 RepID=A0A024U6R4_9STRA|nr:hypothetical protein H310_06868 [Aphanomyces invadans]ETW01303.1 hypothetical protein H310_06868 [Aphanomyces invadans]|eukprot:XP_008870301.1 hypothetical protein H310_06868 [Aphanomyces invadans]
MKHEHAQCAECVHAIHTKTGEIEVRSEDFHDLSVLGQFLAQLVAKVVISFVDVPVVLPLEFDLRFLFFLGRTPRVFFEFFKFVVFFDNMDDLLGLGVRRSGRGCGGGGCFAAHCSVGKV